MIYLTACKAVSRRYYLLKISYDGHYTPDIVL
jgi:hypothetical protein